MDPPWHFCLFLCLGDGRGRSSGDFWALIRHLPPSLESPHIYFIVVYLFRSTDDVSLSLIPLVHVVDQEKTRYGVGHRLSVSSSLPWGSGDAYDVCGASMCPWDMEGGLEPIGVLPSSLQ